MRPAEICQKPPILAIVAGVTLANREPRRVMVGAPGECVQAERAEQETEAERLARKLVEMLFGAGQGHLRLSLDGCGQNLDVLAFAPACRDGQLARLRR